ncbi:PREDICTED: kanadaptin-like [Branchiostoma belcheri]|uniref:Kanadaptin-like n=1 Tax=Branchiostoma belcheri TaxID=7741 RepID=A0A6P4Z0Q2_BRABE|nr:PREDICTED: kanadaptin-like [Branchiostoma belcheri]
MADENVKKDEETSSSDKEEDKTADKTKLSDESKQESPSAFAAFKVPAPFKKPAAFAPKKSSPKPPHPPPHLAKEGSPQKGVEQQRLGDSSDDASEKQQPEPQDKGPTTTDGDVKTKTADESKDSEEPQQVNGDKPKPQHPKEVPSKKKQSPAEKLQAPPLPYKEPAWSSVPDKPYSLEVLKNGCIVSKLELTGKPFYVFGRLDSCDVTLEHPSLSRYHAVVQFRGEGDGERERGFYLYDLGSTHGTWMNKMEVKPKVYYRLRVGYMIKFGGSSRMYILQGPDEDQEEESEMTATELRELHRQEREKAEQADTDDVTESRETQEEEMEEWRSRKKKERDVEEEGISWGMEEDAEEEEEDDRNPFSLELTEEKEAYYVKDPKKALKNFFEREGEELEYEVEEKGTSFHRQFYCRVRLPVEGPDGREQYAEATTSGKKKEAVLACALEACRLLDAYGVLRQQGYKSKRVVRNWEENDYYDSDEDTFTDRTGDVEKKRIRRMKKAGKDENVTHTYDSLSAQHEEVVQELRVTEEKLAAARRKSESEESEDPLEAFMSNMAAGSGLTKVEVSKLRLRLFELRKEEQRLQRLMKVAKPADLPQLSTTSSGKPGETSTGVATKKQPWRNLPLTGAMKGRHTVAKSKPQVALPKPVQVQVPSTMDQEEVEEEEDDVEETKEEPVDMETAQVTASDLQTGTAAIERLQEEEEQPSVTAMDISAASSQESTSKRPWEGEEQGEDQAAADDDQKFVDPKPQVSKKKKSQPKPDPPMSKQYADDDPDYSMWVPPDDQSGDGKTSLNEKFGY